MEMAEYGIKVAMRKCIVYSLCFGAIACLLFILLAPFLSSGPLHGKVSCRPIYAMAISFPFNSLITSLGGYFTGVRRASKTSFSRGISMVAQITLTCYFLYIKSSSSLDEVCTYLVLASTISCIFEFVITYITYVLDSKKITLVSSGVQNNYLKKILRIAFPVAITSYIRSGLSTLKQFLIPFSLAKHTVNSDKALSQYGLINGMTMPIIMFPCIIITSIANLLIPEFARYNIKKDFSRMNQVISFVFKFTAFFSICIIGIFLTFTEELCQLIYRNLEISEFLVLLSPLVILIYLDKIVDAMLRGLDKQVGVMFCNIFDLFLTIMLIYTVVPVYGIYGYIAIIAISEIFNFSVSLVQLYKVTKFKFDYVSYVIIPCVMVLVTKFLFDAVDDYIEYDVGFVIFKILIFVGIYGLLFVSFNVFKFFRQKRAFIIRKI